MKNTGILLLCAFAALDNSTCASEAAADAQDVSDIVIEESAALQNIPAYSLSKQQIEAMSPDTVIDLLRTVPGINVTQQGGSGGLTFISLRGGEPNFTVVIIDGVKVNDIINSRGGGYDFVGLDPLLIQSVDVYFGGLSSVIGSEAMGGIVKITTLIEQESSKALLLEGGSHHQHAEAFHIAERFDRKLLVNVSGAYRDGGDSVEGDSLKRKQINLKLNSLSESQTGWRMSVFSGIGESSSFPEDSGGDQLAVIRQTEEREFRQNNIAGSISTTVNDYWQTVLTASYTRHDEDIINPGIAAGILAGVPPVSSKSQFERSELNLMNSFTLTWKTKLSIGAEVAREKGSFDSIINFGFPVPANFDIDRDIHAFFGEVNHQLLESLSITGGLRYDNADEHEETTLRLAAKYSFQSSGTDVVFQYGEGFKLPSFFALGHPLVGNSNLEPEFSENTSLNVQHPLYGNKLLISATYFYNQFTNLVDFDPILFTNVNRSKVVAKGSELQVTIFPSNTFELSTYLTNTEYVADTGVKLRRRPEWTSGVSLLWKPRDNVSAFIQANYFGDFYDSSIATGLIEMEAYTVVNANLGWQVTPAMRLKFQVDNLLNDNYQETVGFSNPGREFRLNLKVAI